MTDATPNRPDERPSFAELFTPKLVTVFREGYGLQDLRTDALAGLTVAIVALPLSMAIAIASGATPAQGLITAIIGGFLVSLLGGSRFQIGGPAGAFIVLVAATIDRHGIEGMLLATFMAGVFLLALGFLRLGSYIKYIPYPVTVGFTAGIAVIIFASQIKELLGLTLPGREPGALLPKLIALWHALPSVNLAAVMITALSIMLIVGVKRWRPRWPNMLIAVAATAALAALFGLPVETIASRFGAMPNGLPAPALPAFDLERMGAVLPDAIAFALLGAIESLLSAVVADGMSGRRHRSNCELVAQGVANIGAAVFGGICATGAIARTATNVRAGARGPVSGMLHALFLLLFMLVAAPLAAHIPLAALGGVLVVVSWNMADKHEFRTLLWASPGDALVLLSTFLLTIFVDLTDGILVGFALGTLLFMHRMAQSVRVDAQLPPINEDMADGAPDRRTRYEWREGADPSVVIYRISGAFFFGASGMVGTVLDRIGDRHRTLVLDVSQVPFLDSTGAITLAATVRKEARRGVAVRVAGAAPAIRQVLEHHGVRAPDARYAETVAAALEQTGDPA